MVKKKNIESDLHINTEYCVPWSFTLQNQKGLLKSKNTYQDNIEYSDTRYSKPT